MFIKKSFEEIIEENERQIAELETQNEKLDSDIQEFFDELNVTPQQIHAFVSNAENFSQDNWNEIQSHKQKLDAKLQLDIKNIRNPIKTRKTYQGNVIQNNWIFVR